MVYNFRCIHTVLRSVMTRTIDPAPAISTNFSCQLSSTLIACPPPSPPPLDCICEKPPVACGVIDGRPELGCEVCDIPLYLRDESKFVSVRIKKVWASEKGQHYRYFMRTSRVSEPPSEPYILLSMGDISDCLID